MRIYDRRCCAPRSILLAASPTGWFSVCLGVAFIVSCLASLAAANQFVMLDYNLATNARFRDTAFIEVFDDKPLTSDNFMQYVNGGRYDGSFMHRLVRNFVIQGGGFSPVWVDESALLVGSKSLDPTQTVDRDGNPATPNPTVMNEYNVGTLRSNVRGTIAMAKLDGQPNSATNQWFVNLINNIQLDTNNGGFTVFARVVGDGMALYDQFNGLGIQNLNPDANDNGLRDGGPFGEVPMNLGDLVIVEKAKRIDYFGAGITTTVPSGGLNLTRDSFVDTGAAFTGGTGPLIVDPGRTVGIREQIPLGRGLINNGRLEPGLQLGSITVDTYRNGSGGTLAVDLRGTTPDTGHDRLVVAGNAILAGRLDVSLLGGFVPRVGDTFTVLAAGSFTGDFTTFELPMLTAGMVWDINKTATTYSLSVVAADFNRNGVVDAADYAVWRRNRGTTVASSYASGDATGDRMVTDADLAIWRANFGNIRGNTSGAGSGGLAGSPVPEPSTSWIVFLLSTPFAANRRLSSRFRRRAAE